MIRAGDILLTAKRDSVVSSLIRFRLCSEYSHAIPVLGAGSGLNTTWPRGAKVEPIEHYLGGEYQVLRLRPRMKMTADDLRAWTRCAGKLAGLPYDLRSYLGFITNQPLQDRHKLNCAETALLMCHSIGLLLDRNLDRISPQSFAEFAAGGVFEAEQLV